MGTIGNGMSTQIDQVSPCCAMMGSSAAKDKLASSSSPFGGHLHFGMNKQDTGGAAGTGTNVGGGATASNTLADNTIGAAAASGTLTTRSIRAECELNGYKDHIGGSNTIPRCEKKNPIPPKPPPKPQLGYLLKSREKPFRRLPMTLEELWTDDRFLTRFFTYFSFWERSVMARVCAAWRNAAYHPKFWKGVLPVLHCREVRCQSSGDPKEISRLRQRFYWSLQQRGFDAICLCDATDEDVCDFVSNCSLASKHTHHVILRHSSVTDKGLESLLDGIQSVYQLELSGCNEVSEAGLWSSLNPKIVSLTISDCINVADESLGAVAQLLPSLYEFNLQAYHVTDAALAYFSPKQSASLNILRLQSCWEISNQGVGNLVHALPNLTVLSLAGCSKITDAGVEVIAENLRKLKCLDLAWCPRITDAALEYIACDLTQLEELTLDRCVHITDIGIGYISTMLSLNSLFLRWCTQIRDFGLQHLCSMRNLQVLSVAGCPLLSIGGLSALIQLRSLCELELTNCPGASRELFDYLRQHLPNCLIIE